MNGKVCMKTGVRLQPVYRPVYTLSSVYQHTGASVTASLRSCMCAKLVARVCNIKSAGGTCDLLFVVCYSPSKS